MPKLNIYQTSRSGKIQGAKLFHETIASNKFGRIIAPSTQEEDDDLQAGSALGSGYWPISPEDLKNEADLRINKIFSPGKVDKLFALPEAEQTKVIDMLNENLNLLISESLSSSKSVSKKGKASAEDGASGEETSGEEDGGKEEVPTLKESKIEDLKEILTAAGVTFDAKAKKAELYKLVYGIS